MRKPLDHGAGPQLHRAETRDDLRVEAAERWTPAAGGGHHIPLAGAGTAASRRAMIASVSTPSDSA